MKLLAISGSLRAASTNTAMLRALAEMAPAGIDIALYERIGSLPVFSPDQEGEGMPPLVRAFEAAVRACDGVIIASPEYVRGIPGGLKNALDWLVASDVLAAKPIALAHASHRGDDMLDSLRKVLGTVSTRFAAEVFLRLPLGTASPAMLRERMLEADAAAAARRFLEGFAAFCTTTA